MDTGVRWEVWKHCGQQCQTDWSPGVLCFHHEQCVVRTPGRIAPLRELPQSPVTATTRDCGSVFISASKHENKMLFFGCWCKLSLSHSASASKSVDWARKWTELSHEYVWCQSLVILALFNLAKFKNILAYKVIISMLLTHSQHLARGWAESSSSHTPSLNKAIL